MKQINFSIDDRVYANLEKHGLKHGYKPTAYAKVLFEAAYAARVGVQPDVDLDQQIEMVIVLYGARKDSLTISKIARLSEPTVLRVIDAWRQERLFA